MSLRIIMSNVPTVVVIGGGYLLCCAFSYALFTALKLPHFWEIANLTCRSARHGATSLGADLTLSPCRVRPRPVGASTERGARAPPVLGVYDGCDDFDPPAGRPGRPGRRSTCEDHTIVVTCTVITGYVCVEGR